jgi:hypothetical protein
MLSRQDKVDGKILSVESKDHPYALEKYGFKKHLYITNMMIWGKTIGQTTFSLTI